MRKLIFIALVILWSAVHLYAADGVVNVPSIFSVEKTADRIETILEEKGITIFNRIDHSEAASKIDIELRDTELIIFGNPILGSPLMKCEQSVALDLPQKLLIWEDENDQVWISYNDPGFLAKRHNITDCEEVLLKIEKALSAIAKTAATE